MCKKVKHSMVHDIHMARARLNFRLAEERADGFAITGGVLAEGEGPGAIAMAIRRFAEEPDVAADGDLLAERTEIGTELVVADEPNGAILDVGAKTEREFLLGSQGKTEGFDLPAKLSFGFLSHLIADAGVIDAAAFDLREPKEAIEFEAHFGIGFVLELEPEPIVGDIAQFFADIDDEEIIFAADIDASEEGTGGILPSVGEELVLEHQLELRRFNGGDEIMGDEGGRLVRGDAAVLLEPLFLADTFAALQIEPFRA
jgi:hypothetical protein